MRNNKNKSVFGRLAIIISIIVLAIAAVLAVFFILEPGKKETIKIGAILPISGIASHAGEELKDGMLLAAQEINSWGGINGREIEFIIGDSKTDPGEGKEAFKKIEATHYPLLYISMVSSVSMALTPLIEENEVVLVGLFVTNPKFTEQNEWVFRYFPKAENEVLPLLLILQNLKIKKLGILYVNDEYGKPVFELLKEKFKSTGGILRSEAFKPEETNLKEHIAKLKDMEAIYAVGFSSHLKSTFRQLREEHFRGSIFGGIGATNPAIISMPEANGVYVSAPIIFDPNYLFDKELKEKYEARYNKSFSQYAANGYDFVEFLTGLLEDEEISRSNVKRLLEEGFIYSGVFGSIDVKLGEHDITYPLYPARIVDGKIKYLR